MKTTDLVPRVFLFLPFLVLAEAAAAQTAPFAATHPATPVTATSATLNGMIAPNGLPTDAWFEWGARGRYDQQTSGVGLGTEMGVLRVNQEINGLTNQGIYQFRLRADGTVVAWGSQSAGQAAVPAGLSNVVAVAGGWYHSLALLADGTINGWGQNNSGKASGPAGPGRWVAVASAGGDHNVALRGDGTVHAWGQDRYGSTPGNSWMAAQIPTGSGRPILRTSIIFQVSGFKFQVSGFRFPLSQSHSLMVS